MLSGCSGERGNTGSYRNYLRINSVGGSGAEWTKKYRNEGEVVKFKKDTGVDMNCIPLNFVEETNIDMNNNNKNEFPFFDYNNNRL